MIVPRRWRDVTNGMRVIDPAGQMFHVLPRFLPALVQLRDRSGHTHTMSVDPNVNVPTMLEPHDIAISNLAAAFPGLEYLGESR